MAIVRMINTRSPGELRAFQASMITVGRIRLGIYATPEGKRPRPEKLDRFRFTAPDEALIRAVAEEYGGTARPWSPASDSKRREWEVITDSAELQVYIVNGQKVDPTYEAWAAGRTCVRRCDGEWNSQGPGEPCVCNGLHPDKRPPAPKDMCKPTTRVQVMLSRIPGIGSWMLESHGENAATEMALLAGFIATAPVPVPAVLRLEHETRREWNPEKRGGPGFETREFYVPRFHISAVNAQQIAVGGDALTRALQAAGAPAALSGDTRRALEAAAPVSAPAAPVQQHDEGTPVDDEERNRILVAIEGAPTLARLDGIREGLAKRGIRAKAIQDAWVSKRKAIEAADRLAEQLAKVPDEPEYRIGDTVVVGGIEFTKIGDDPFNHPFADERKEYDEAIARGATMQAILDAGGPAHWLAADDQAQERASDTLAEALGAESVEISVEVHEGVVEDGPGPRLPELPDGDYDAEELYTMIMTGAGQQNPPLTTAEVNTLISSTLGVPPVRATGHQLARLRAGLKAGTVSWRS